MRGHLIRFCLLIILEAVYVTGHAQQDIVRVAAASDLKFALDSVVHLFEESSGAKITVTYGSSGKLFEQISNGAPFDIFFSADRMYPEKLRDKGLARNEPRLYGIGRIVVWSSVVNPAELKMASLAQQKIRKIAIANPQHAPYGKRAVEAMQYFKIYDQVKAKLVLGENISQASQFLYSGAAEVGIIALSLALSPPMQKLNGHYYEIPEESHLPLEQTYILLSRAKNNAMLDKFDVFLSSDRARRIFRTFGFSVPDDNLR